MIGICVGRNQCEATFEFGLGLFPLPIMKPQHGRQWRVGFREIWVEFQRRHRCSFGGGERRFRRSIAVPSQEHIGISQAGKGQSIFRISFNCLLKVVDRLVKSLLGPLIPVMTTLQVQPVSFGILSMTFTQPLLFGAGQLQPQFPGYLVGNLVLHLKNFAGLAIILGSPKLTASDCIH